MTGLHQSHAEGVPRVEIDRIEHDALAVFGHGRLKIPNAMSPGGVVKQLSRLRMAGHAITAVRAERLTIFA